MPGQGGSASGPHPLVWGAVAAAFFSLWPGRGGAPLLVPSVATAPSAGAVAAATAGAPALCGPRMVPEGDVCVPLPAAGAPLERAVVGPLPAAPRQRAWEQNEQIPRLPERPAELGRYAWPFGEAGAAPSLLAEGDSDRPGLDFVAVRGEGVRVLALERQTGGAEVAFVGDLFGVTVVTSHLVGEPERQHRYVVVHGHLDRPGPGVVQGAKLAAGDVLGFVGDTGTPGVVHLYLEVRQVREGIDLASIDLSRLADASITIACDPRNVLPLLP